MRLHLLLSVAFLFGGGAIAHADRPDSAPKPLEGTTRRATKVQALSNLSEQ